MANLKRLFHTLALIFLMQAVAESASAKPRSQSVTGEDIALARSYVLASCLMAHYADTSIAREADAWAAGLVENGRIPGRAYSDLAEIGRTKAPAALTSTTGVPLRFDSCLKLYNDTNLPALIRQVLLKSQQN